MSTARGRIVRLVRGHWADALFWTLLAGLTTATIHPVWMGPFAPLMDFGGHLSILDAYARLDDSELLSSFLERRGGFVPNLLAARFAGLLHPLLEPMTSLRLWITAALLLQVAGLLWFARTFDRSRWQVFICIPFMWSAPLVVGFVNFLPIVGLIFIGMCIGRRAGEDGGWRWAAAAGVVCMLAYLMHGIGFVFVAAFTGLMIVLRAGRPRRLLYLLTLAPAALIWGIWMHLASAWGDGPLSGQLEYFSPTRLVMFAEGDVLNLTRDSGDLRHMLGFASIWLVWVALAGADRTGGTSTPPAGPIGRVRGAALAAWRELRRHSILAALAAMCACVCFLPTYTSGVAVGYRMMQPAAMVLLLLPRPRMRGLLPAASIAAAILLGFSWTGLVRGAFDRYHETESEALMQAVDHIQQGSRVACVNTETATSNLHFRTMEHGCYGLVQYYARSFAGSHFAETNHNAVRYRDDVKPRKVEGTTWDSARALLAWDYILVHGEKLRRYGRYVEQAHFSPSIDGGSSWRLYRVVNTEPKMKIMKQAWPPPASTGKVRHY